MVLIISKMNYKDAFTKRATSPSPLAISPEACSRSVTTVSDALPLPTI